MLFKARPTTLLFQVDVAPSACGNAVAIFSAASVVAPSATPAVRAGCSTNQLASVCLLLIWLVVVTVT